MLNITQSWSQICKNILCAYSIFYLASCQDNTLVNIGQLNVQDTEYKIIRKTAITQIEPIRQTPKYMDGESGIFVYTNFIKDSDVYIAYNPLGLTASNPVTIENGVFKNQGTLFEEDNYTLGRLRDWKEQRRPRFLIKAVKTFEPTVRAGQSKILIVAGYKESNRKARISLYDYETGNTVYDFEYKKDDYQGVYINNIFIWEGYVPKVKYYDWEEKYGYTYEKATHIYGIGSVSVNNKLRPYIMALRLIIKNNQYVLEYVGDQVFESIEGELDNTYNNANVILGHTEKNVIILTSTAYKDFAQNAPDIGLKTWFTKEKNKDINLWPTQKEAESNIGFWDDAPFKMSISSNFSDGIINNVSCLQHSFEYPFHSIESDLVVNMTTNKGIKNRFFSNIKDLKNFQEFEDGSISSIQNSSYRFSGGFPKIESINDQKKEIQIQGGFGEEIYFNKEGNRSTIIYGDDTKMQFLTGENGYHYGASDVKLAYDSNRRVLILKGARGWIF